jgi:hypothetical protein
VHVRRDEPVHLALGNDHVQHRGVGFEIGHGEDLEDGVGTTLDQFGRDLESAVGGPEAELDDLGPHQSCRAQFRLSSWLSPGCLA